MHIYEFKCQSDIESINLERSYWGRIKQTRNDANPWQRKCRKSGQCLPAKSVFM